MTIDEWITVAVLAAMFATLLLDRFAPSGVVLAATITLLVTDVIDADAAFSGFSNPAPITVAALFVLAAGAERTGLLTSAVVRLLDANRGVGGRTRLLVPTALASAALNNTPLVAMLIPEVVAWARRTGRSASRYLLPLSYAAILGGTLTVLGTSTNLVVSGLLAETGADPIGVFELARIGLPVAVVGFIVLIGVSVRLLPERTTAPDQIGSSTREFLVEMRVADHPSVTGRSVAEAGLRHLAGVYLVQLRRRGRMVAPVGPDEILEADDLLTFAGQVTNVLDLQRMPGLVAVDQPTIEQLDAAGRSLFEVVVGRMSPIVGQTLREADFRARYGGAVLAVHRSGRRVETKLGDIRLRHGDTLVVVAGGDFRVRHGERDFLVVAELDAPPPTADSKAPVVAAVAVGFVVLATTGVLTTVEGALVAAAALVATRVLSFTEAKRAVDLDVVLLIGAAFGLGAAVQQSGLALRLADAFTSAFGGLGTFGLVLGVVFATSALTEMVTNNAAAVVVFPIALAIAESADLDVRLMAAAVAVAASTSFLSPIGYQTNTMVYGPGGYRVTDYLRAGLPLSVAVQLTIATTVTILS